MSQSHRFTLEVSINSVACDITVNDVPIVRNYSGSRIDMTIPVSDFMRSGRNTVVIRSMIDRSEGGFSATRATATLLATPYAQTDWRPLFSVATRAVVGGDGETTNTPGESLLGPVTPQSASYDADIMILEASRSVDLHARMPTWAWQGGDEIPELDEVTNSVVGWYRHFLDLLEARRVDVVSGLLAEKVSELSRAHNLAGGIVENEIGLPRAIADDSLTLRRPDWDNLVPEYAATNRLVRLYHPRKGAVVSYVNPIGVIHTYDFWLRRGPSDWIITR